MDLPINMEMALPREVAYPLPTTLPPGMRQVRLRQPQYAAIVDPLPAGAGIDLIIPEIPGAFGDPSTTSVEVTGFFESRFDVPAGRPFWMQSATCNGCIWGSGNSIFQRYQLYLLTSVLSDDITEWGLTAHLMFLSSYDRHQRLELAAIMGFNQYEPSSSMGLALAGVSNHDAAYIATDVGSQAGLDLWNVSGRGNVLDDFGNQYPTSQNSYLFSIDNFNSNVTNGNAVGANAFSPQKRVSSVGCYRAGSFTLRQPFQFNLQMPGIIGSGSSQLFPMFIGPYKISLFADDPSNYMWWDLNMFTNGTGKELFTNYLQDGPGAAGAYVGTPNSVTVQNSLHITHIYFQCDYIQCDGPSFAIIMSQLPIPDTFALRTTAWTSASTILPENCQGVNDLAIPIRRASLKCCYCLFSPARDPVNSPAGKFEWVNPNLGSNTLIHINGKPYPQMGLDPTNRPNECFKNFLLTIGTWNNDGPKSCIEPHNFFVLDYRMTQNDTKSIRYNRWRHYQTTSTRKAAMLPIIQSIVNNAVTLTVPENTPTNERPGLYATTVPGNNETTRPLRNLKTYSDVDWITPGGPYSQRRYAGMATSFSPYAPSQLAGTAYTASDPTVNAAGGLADAAALLTYINNPAHRQTVLNAINAYDFSSLIQHEGTRCPRIGQFSTLNPNFKPSSNQFILAYDFEHLAKVQYLSGVQSLTGSFFLKLNIEQNLSVPYGVTFVCAFDQLVILQSAMKTAFVRI